MGNLKLGGLSMVSSVLLLAACGGTANDHNGAGAGPEVVASDGAPVVIEVGGRAFMLREAWSDTDFERILDEGRPELPSTTPEVLAAQMRAHMIKDGHYYIELEPNLELADEILNSPQPTPTTGQAPREARTIIGSDNRTHWGTNLSYPATAIGFNNSRGSGVKIASHALYTNAHVIYETFASTNGWYCNNESVANSCATWPAWRFGVEGTSGFTSFTSNGCYWQTITTAFIGLTSGSSMWDIARWDYAAINTGSCSDGNTGWFGTLIATDQQLLDMSGFEFGYAERATCPTGSTGTAGTNLSSTDCPGTGSWPGSTWQLTGLPGSAPYTGARLWFGSDNNVAAGDGNAAFTVKSTMDVTHGNSGGPLYWQTNDRYVVGACSGQNTTTTAYNRFSSEVYNFLHAYAPFPQP